MQELVASCLVHCLNLLLLEACAHLAHYDIFCTSLLDPAFNLLNIATAAAGEPNRLRTFKYQSGWSVPNFFANPC